MSLNKLIESFSNTDVASTSVAIMLTLMSLS